MFAAVKRKMPISGEHFVPLVQSQITFPVTPGTLLLTSWVTATYEADVSS